MTEFNKRVDKNVAHLRALFKVRGCEGWFTLPSGARHCLCCCMAQGAVHPVSERAPMNLRRATRTATATSTLMSLPRSSAWLHRTSRQVTELGGLHCKPAA